MLTPHLRSLERLLPAGSIRYGIKSVGGMAAGLALLTAWVELFAIPPQLAIFLNVILLGVVGTLVLDRWVFADSPAATTPRGFVTRFLGVQSAMLSGKAVNYVIYVLLIEGGVIYQVAWVGGSGVSFVLTFVLNRWVFGRLSD